MPLKQKIFEILMKTGYSSIFISTSSKYLVIKIALQTKEGLELHKEGQKACLWERLKTAYVKATANILNPGYAREQT